ncbi:phage/plasmid primase, P4 family [Ralstonia insidiosa]|uniref:phage/plasmid primase, P4 family n=1 Tax=Ralstonia insidiosa TaxID=190721 RepID=UPI000CEE497B|nr:phage/plasmid primase, P4 family [Ralstonia insidiosa]
MPFNQNAALQHKKLLHGGHPAIFQAYPDKGTRANTKTIYGPLDKNRMQQLADVVHGGSALSIAVNTFRDGRRTKENAARINAFLVDLDGSATLEDIKQWPIQPHLITETSPGHYHALWRISGCPISAFTSIQKLLAKKLGGDPNVCDVARTMRLAGTVNRKNGRTHQVRIVFIKAGDDTKPIKFEDFVRAFGFTKKKSSTPKSQPGVTMQADLAEVQNALDKLPADERHVWLRIGMALHSTYPGDQGKRLWDQWSQKARDHFDQKDQDRTWANFKPGGGVTKGTLFYMANMAGARSGNVAIPSTESELAKLFVETYKGEVAFDHQSSTWWVFDSAWRKGTHLAMRRCKSMVESVMTAVRECHPDPQNGLLKAVRRHMTTPGLTNILRHATLEGAIDISSTSFDCKPQLLGVPNGVVELETGAYRNARSEDLITLRCRAEHDPKAQCVAFKKFIDDITSGDQELASYLQRALGYSLFGHTREQVFFMIMGPGANGKGVLLRTIAKVLGNYATTVAPNLLQRAYSSNPNGPSPAIMALRSARLYLCSEFDGQKRFDEAFVKQLSGSDPLTGRSNFGEQETFEPTGKLWLSLNFEPEIAYDNEAMWRRLRAIPLLRRFTGKNRDNDLESKLANELPGVLNWLIEGAQLYAEKGLVYCAQVDDATRKLRERSDTVRSWYSRCCAKREAGEIQGANDVYKSYVAYTRNGNRSPLPMPKFNARLQKLGAQHVRRSISNGWKGFVLLEN